MATQSQEHNAARSDTAFTRVIFNSPRWAWLWLIARLYVGYTWLHASLSRLSGPAWTRASAALKTSAQAPIAFDWYRVFQQGLLNSGAYTWLPKLLIAGELLLGIMLILGVFTGAAATLAGFMALGLTGVHPLLLAACILLVLAWKRAGWWGLDRWLLPALRMPSQPQLTTLVTSQI